MKKIALVLMVSLFLVGMISCDKSTETITSSSSDTINATTETQLTTTQGIPETTETPETSITTISTATIGLTQAEIDAVSTEAITIEFDYYLGNAESDSLIEMIEAFELIYTNVDIVATRASQVASVTSDYINAVMGGDTSDLILTQQEYLSIVAGNVEPLNKYINSTATFNGRNVGVEKEDLELNFFTNYIEDDGILSYPFVRRTQLLFANKDLLSANATALAAQGINISTDGYLSNTTPLTIAELSSFQSVIQDKSIVTIENTYNLMNTWLSQQSISMFNQNNYDFNMTDMVDFSTQLRTLGSNSTLDVADSYSSTAFNSQETIFGVSDSYSLRYMIEHSDFNVQILPMISTDEVGAAFYGSDFAISKYSSDAEKFYSWMFIQFVTSFESDYMSFCYDYGYTPIYKTSVFLLNQDYTDFMSVSSDYLTSYPNWPADDSRWDDYHLSMIQLAYGVLKQNVYQYSFLRAANAGQVEGRIEAWNGYLLDVFDIHTNLTEIVETLEDELN